jgi:GxxExxY protein
MNTDKHRWDEITNQTIGCAYTVSNALGCGFLERVYENALVHELRKTGLRLEQQKRITIKYDGIVVGDYVADLLVEDTILVETKAVKIFDEIHMAQCLNYLKATELELCLLINFGTPRIKVKRIINN